jgi:hypothetical protein
MSKVDENLILMSINTSLVKIALQLEAISQTLIDIETDIDHAEPKRLK